MIGLDPPVAYLRQQVYRLCAAHGLACPSAWAADAGIPALPLLPRRNTFQRVDLQSPATSASPSQWCPVAPLAGLGTLAQSVLPPSIHIAAQQKTISTALLPPPRQQTLPAKSASAASAA